MTKPALTFADLIPKFLAWAKRERGLRSSTLKEYARELKRVAAYWGPREVARASVRDLAGFKATLAGLAPQTRKHRLLMVKLLLDHAVEVGLIARHPLDVVLPEIKRPTVVEVAGEEEMARLLATEDDRVRAVVLMGGDLGLRRGEMVRARAEDLVRRPFPALRLPVRDLDADQPKSGAARLVPCFTARAWDALERLAASRRGGDRLLGLASPESVVGVVRGHWIGAVGHAPHLHALRRRFASRLLERGLELDAVRQLLGHKDVSTTMRYLGVNSEELAVVRKFGGALSPAGLEGAKEGEGGSKLVSRRGLEPRTRRLRVCCSAS